MFGLLKLPSNLRNVPIEKAVILLGITVTTVCLPEESLEYLRDYSSVKVSGVQAACALFSGGVSL
jgi:hypothetical protein